MRGARRAAMPDSVVDWWLSPRPRAPRVGSSLERRRPVESESQRAVSLPPKLLEIARDGNHGLYATVSIGGSRRQLDAAGSRTDRAAGSRTETAPRAAVDGRGRGRRALSHWTGERGARVANAVWRCTCGPCVSRLVTNLLRAYGLRPVTKQMDGIPDHSVRLGGIPNGRVRMMAVEDVKHWTG